MLKKASLPPFPQENQMKSNFMRYWRQSGLSAYDHKNTISFCGSGSGRIQNYFSGSELLNIKLFSFDNFQIWLIWKFALYPTINNSWSITLKITNKKTDRHSFQRKNCDDLPGKKADKAFKRISRVGTDLSIKGRSRRQASLATGQHNPPRQKISQNQCFYTVKIWGELCRPVASC